MPEIFTTTTGIFPKITSEKTYPNLRVNLHKLDRGEISADEFEVVIQKNIERAVGEQISVGIDFPTDGSIRWMDLFSPFVRSWEGITRRGIHRFYNTNTLYGEPVVEGELLAPQVSDDVTSNKTLEDFKFAQKISSNTKAILPGVFTFTNACVDNFYQDSQRLRSAISRNLIKEAQNLILAGAKIIEIHEIELAWSQFSIKEISEIYSEFGKLDAKIIVISYFKNFSSEVAEALVEVGCGIGIDFSQLVEFSNLPENTVLQAGVVDSRETKLEKVEDLQKLKSEILTKFSNCSEIIFSTSSHVEYLPHARAIEKISLLKNLK